MLQARVASPADVRAARAPAALSLPRILAAAAGGLLLLAAFPPYDAWPLAPLGVAALLVAVRGCRPRAGAALGLVHGLAFFVPLLSWSGIEVGPVPWLLLALSQAAFVAGAGAGLAVSSRLPAWPLAAAALWVAQEAARSRLPWGGFPWGRLGLASADAPWLHLAPLGGVPLVSFAVALLGGLLAAAWVCRGRWRALACAAALAVLVAPLAVPLPVAGPREAVVAVVQGNVPDEGLDFAAERERVLRNHVEATRRLADSVAAGALPRPDLVVWPENSSDIDPFTDPGAYALIDGAVRAVGVPVLVGSLVLGQDRRVLNTGVVWDPVTGPGATYVKRRPVPFAEYIPLRPLARLVSPYVDRYRPRDMGAGEEPGVLELGGVTVGDVICFEVAYDGLVRDVAARGGELLAVQTNNATFGRTAETEQQLVMSRVRAAEHGRATLVAATSGASAVIRPGGGVLQRSELFTPDLLVERVPLADGPTLATRLAWAPEAALVLAGLAALGLALRGRRR